MLVSSARSWRAPSMTSYGSIYLFVASDGRLLTPTASDRSGATSQRTYVAYLSCNSNTTIAAPIQHDDQNTVMDHSYSYLAL